MVEPSTISRTDVHTFSSLPFDIHVYIVKLLNLRDALVYAELSPEANAAVKYVFDHRKKLDFGFLLGSTGQIMLSDIAMHT